MPAPYYQDEHVTLYHGDAREVTAWLDADVLVTDPPYGQAYRSNMADATSKLARAIAGDEDTSTRDDVLALWGDRPRIVFEGRNVEPLQPRIARLVWHKPGAGMGDLSIPWKPDYEFISVNGDGFHGPRDSSVITAPLREFRGATKHPHAKPVPVLEALIAKCPAGIIAEPFAGSGTTLIAARNLGRQAIGVEVEERYCQIIADRLAQRAFDFAALMRPATDETRAAGWANEPDADLFTPWAPE